MYLNYICNLIIIITNLFDRAIPDTHAKESLHEIFVGARYAVRERFSHNLLLVYTFLSDRLVILDRYGFRKSAFPAIRTWHVETRARRTCNGRMHLYLAGMESDPFTFVLFRLSVSATLPPSPSFYSFLVLLPLPLILHDGYVIS